MASENFNKADAIERERERHQGNHLPHNPRLNPDRRDEDQVDDEPLFHGIEEKYELGGGD